MLIGRYPNESVLWPKAWPVRTWTFAAFATLALLGQPAPLATAAEKTGKEVVDSACIACHGTGVNGAPKIGDSKAWSKRASQGLSSLTQNALKGIRQMPAHGGNPGLSDFEI